MQWASAAKEHLATLSDAVERLRGVFETGPETPPETVSAVASHVITACSGISAWLSSSHAPTGLRKAEGELGAAAGVYRNAAVALRSLTGADDLGQRQVRSTACAALLDQGDHHVETFAETLTKKLGDTG